MPENDFPDTTQVKTLAAYIAFHFTQSHMSGISADNHTDARVKRFEEAYKKLYDLLSKSSSELKE